MFFSNKQRMTLQKASSVYPLLYKSATGVPLDRENKERTEKTAAHVLTKCSRLTWISSFYSQTPTGAHNIITPIVQMGKWRP